MFLQSFILQPFVVSEFYSQTDGSNDCTNVSASSKNNSTLIGKMFHLLDFFFFHDVWYLFGLFLTGICSINLVGLALKSRNNFPSKIASSTFRMSTQSYKQLKYIMNQIKVCPGNVSNQVPQPSGRNRLISVFTATDRYIRRSTPISRQIKSPT